MGIRNQKREALARISAKSLDARFLTEIEHGLNCSPFEAEAVLEVVREIYLPYLSTSDQASLMPGRISLVAISADEPAGKSVSDCHKVTVTLGVHRGPHDDLILSEQGPEGFRRARIPDLCQEALSQGGVLTVEDLASHVFFVSARTITRDLSALRKADPHTPLPLRSIRQDIGPILTHRTQIVSLALEGKTMTEICTIMRHSPEAVANYLSTFTRCCMLSNKQLEVGQIAYLVRRGRSLVEAYLELQHEALKDANKTYHLNRLLEITEPGSGEKKALQQVSRRIRP